MAEPMSPERLEEIRQRHQNPYKILATTAELELLAEVDRLRADRDDLRWIVGHLAGNCPDVGAVPLPPRLAPVARECIETYQPGRFTLAVTLETTDD